MENKAKLNIIGDNRFLWLCIKPTPYPMIEYVNGSIPTVGLLSKMLINNPMIKPRITPLKLPWFNAKYTKNIIIKSGLTPPIESMFDNSTLNNIETVSGIINFFI